MRLVSLARQNSTKMPMEQAVPKTHAMRPILTTMSKASALAAQAPRSYQKTSFHVSAQSTSLHQETIAPRNLAFKSRFCCQPASVRTVICIITLMPRERLVSKTPVTPLPRSWALVASAPPAKTTPIQMLTVESALETLVIPTLSTLPRMESVSNVMTIFTQAEKVVFKILVM